MKKEIVCPVCEGKGYVSWINCTETSCGSVSKTCPHCNGTRWVEVDFTNADHIRSMTDEELAEFLCDATYKENEQRYPVMRTVNKVWWRKWLKQPYAD